MINKLLKRFAPSPQAVSTWGVVTTTIEDTDSVKRFVAHHLMLGAKQVTVYLDKPNPTLFSALDQMPGAVAINCDDTFWTARPRGRPRRHQQRQSQNATQAYHQSSCDWVAHIDVDEFLHAGDLSIGALLAAQPSDVQTLRLAPVEALAFATQTSAPPNRYYFKKDTFGPKQRAILRDLYPTFGEHLTGHFVGHRQGKIFARTGLEGAKFKIHNLAIGDAQNPGLKPIDEIHLCHFLSFDFDDWNRKLEFRMKRGAFSGEMPKRGDIRATLERCKDADGVYQVKPLHDEICTASEDHLRKLSSHDLMVELDFDFDRSVAQFFENDDSQTA